MRVLAIDQSLKHTAAVTLESFDCDILTIDDVKTLETKSTGVWRIRQIYDWIRGVIVDQQADLLVREQHTMRQFGSAANLHMVTGLIDFLASDFEYLERKAYAIVTPGVWKKFILGKGNLKKDTAYLMTVNKKLKESLLVDIEDDIDNDNVADAVCLGATGYFAHKILNGVDTINVPQGSETALAKQVESIFDYGLRK